ncbi:MAG: FAD-dependent oxidoreductase [Sphingomonas sp.]
MAEAYQTSVVIVGAGPVGLCLALDLASRGIACTIIEQRAAGDQPSVKCNHVSSRTMEIFRRLGIADAVRAVGLPDDYPNDVTMRTRATGHEMMRIHIPSRNDRFSDTWGPDGWWPTPEPPHRANQIFFEPILYRAAAASPNVVILDRTEFVRFEQDNGGVTAFARDLDSGEDVIVNGAFLVGCEGARSIVRRAIGARLSGDEMLQRVQSSYIRAPGLLERITKPDAWMSYLYSPERSGNLFAIDGKTTWLIHNYLLPDEGDFETVDRDFWIRSLLGVDPDFEYELLAKEDWVGRRMLADRFRLGRAFICGDAAHLWVPYAGYGMNAGIADAINLSWILAAHINGWAPEAILDSYERERQPITDQVSRFAMQHALGAISERTSVPAAIEKEDAEGELVRAKVGEAAYQLHVQQFACAGLNYGYFYEASPLIVYDMEDAPSYTMYDYKVSSVPGCRTPHFWLADGRSLYDALGPDYTVLRFDPAADVTALMAAAASAGLPLMLLDIEAEDIPAAYRHRLLLSRPDRHIAWRGDALPTDVTRLIDRIRGALAHEAAGVSDRAAAARSPASPVALCDVSP